MEENGIPGCSKQKQILGLFYRNARGGEQMVRRAVRQDVSGIEAVYNDILDLEAAGKSYTGWVKGIYPCAETALEAIEKEEMYVMEEDGRIVASAKINREQVPEYVMANWEQDAPEAEVMVIHTLTVSPKEAGKGYGSKFIKFYEDFALEHGCRYLRMDTNEINEPARRLYKKLGYKEVGIIPCIFNGIEGVRLVCLEKTLR